jgi:predicted porin
LYDSSKVYSATNPNKYSGLASGVRWKIAGAVSLGANSHMIGNMEAGGAIAVGADDTCDDLKAGGAITLGAGAVCGNLEAGGAVTLGANAKGGTVYTAAAFTWGAGATPTSISLPPTNPGGGAAAESAIRAALTKCKDAVAKAEAALLAA